MSEESKCPVTGNNLGTSYSPPVKCKLQSLKLQRDNEHLNFKAHIAPESC